MLYLMRPGTRVQPVMGVNSHKQGTVIARDPAILKTDGRGIPQMGKGHYKPLTDSDVLVQFDDGSHDTFNKHTLRKLTS